MQFNARFLKNGSVHINEILLAFSLPCGVQKRFNRTMFSSLTPCSFRTFMAFTTVFPVPVVKINLHLLKYEPRAHH